MENPAIILEKKKYKNTIKRINKFDSSTFQVEYPNTLGTTHCKLATIGMFLCEHRLW